MNPKSSKFSRKWQIGFFKNVDQRPLKILIFAISSEYAIKAFLYNLFKLQTKQLKFISAYLIDIIFTFTSAKIFTPQCQFLSFLLIIE
jgi:hypothetical protein